MFVKISIFEGYSTKLLHKNKNVILSQFHQELDLSYVAGLNDVALYKMLSAPKDSRPGK